MPRLAEKTTRTSAPPLETVVGFSSGAKLLLAVLLALTAAGMAACSNDGTKRVKANAPSSVPLVWPAPPEKARIAYGQSIRQPGDVGIKRSAIVRFARWVVGSDKGREAFSKPFGIAVDEDDNLCITDTGANTVSFWDRKKQKWRRWEKLGKSFHFASPVAVTKRNGIFYVADSGHGSVVAFDESGKLKMNITEKLERPSGVAIAGERLMVADSQRHCVLIFDLTGRYLSEFGRRGTGAGEFNFPTHIATDASANIYVTDSMNGRIQVFGPTGALRNQIGSTGDSPGEFSRPKGVAADSSGRVYVVDALFDNMQIFSGDGQLLLNFAASGSGPGQFWLPNGVAITSNNEIFVADSYNQRVETFKYVGDL